MSDYTKSYNGAAKDAAQSTILGSDFDTEFSAIETAVGTKANKVIPAAVNNVAVLSSSGDLVDSTVTSTELGFLDGATAGTQVASKAVVADANINTGVSKVTELHIGASGSETQVTSTPAELNILDGATLTTTELNYVDGVTSAIQTQLDTNKLYAWNTIATSSPSAVADVQFVNGVGGVVFDGTYDEYRVICEQLIPATDNVKLHIRVTEDAGVSFVSTNRYVPANDVTPTSEWRSNGTSHIGNLSTEGITIEMVFRNPSAADKLLQLFSITQNVAYDSTGTRNQGIVGTQGGYTNATAYDGIQIFFDSGNIASGSITLQGRKI